MSAPSEKGQGLAATILAREGGQAESADGLADAFSRTINSLHRRLSVYIGEQGFAAVFARALHLAQQDHPFLQGVKIGSLGAREPLLGLRQAVNGRDLRLVRDGIVAVLAHFCDLLTGFVGAEFVNRVCNRGSTVDTP